LTQSFEGARAMESRQTKPAQGKLDTKEFELPETVFVRDIENRVFQGIVLKCLSTIEGVTPIEGNFIDNILGRDSLEGIRGIHIEQDSNHQCVSIKLEVNIGFGVSIPAKAEEIQTTIAEEVTQLTGLHVSDIHVVFKNIVPDHQLKKAINFHGVPTQPQVLIRSEQENEYNDEF
jgi:uncharacterized alkaline shock family protein YloU